MLSADDFVALENTEPQEAVEDEFAEFDAAPSGVPEMAAATLAPAAPEALPAAEAAEAAEGAQQAEAAEEAEATGEVKATEGAEATEKAEATEGAELDAAAEEAELDIELQQARAEPVKLQQGPLLLEVAPR